MAKVLNLYENEKLISDLLRFILQEEKFLVCANHFFVRGRCKGYVCVFVYKCVYVYVFVFGYVQV